MPRLALVLAVAAGLSMPQHGYDDTPFLPGGKWRVHDSRRPAPPVVAPGATPGAPPSDAIVLFDGRDLARWRGAKGEPGWKVGDGWMEVAGGAGDLVTRDSFADIQLHLEWRAPEKAKGEGQARGNSGVFLCDRYEIQILDSHGNATYADGQAAALYGQFPPLVNASRPAGEWQTYDVVFVAPRFQDGKVASPGVVTVFHNGVLVHHATALVGATAHRAVAKFEPHPPEGPIRLQDHGDPVRFRNVWVRPLRGYDER